MKNYMRFVAIGFVFALGVEVQYRLLGRFNPKALAAAVFLYPIILSLAWLGGRMIDWRLRRQLTADIVCYFACGVAGLAVEWSLLGNSPAANPNAFQIGMFCMWTTFCFGPRLLIRDDDSSRSLRRGIWMLFGGYFALSTVLGLLMSAPQTRFVLIILTSVAAHIGMNGLLLWLMVKQHRFRKERNRRPIPGEASVISEASAESVE